jgi:hypothetical protein
MGASLPVRIKARFNAMKYPSSHSTKTFKVTQSAEKVIYHVLEVSGSTVSPFSEAC